MMKVLFLIAVLLCLSPPQLEAVSIHCGYHGHYYTTIYTYRCYTKWYKVYYGFCSYGYLTSDYKVYSGGVQLYYYRTYCSIGKRSVDGIRETVGDSRVKKNTEVKKSVKNVQESDYDTILQAFSSGTNNKRDVTGLSTNVPE